MIPEPRLVTSRAGTLAVRAWSENGGTPLVCSERLLDRLSPAWAGLAGMPVLLLLATKPPHVDQNREHLPRFQTAVPHALGDEVAEWIRSSGA